MKYLAALLTTLTVTYSTGFSEDWELSLLDSLLSDLEDAEVVAGTVVGCVLAAEEGAVVEAELDLLYTAEQVKELSLAQLRQGVEQRLYYDEFQ